MARGKVTGEWLLILVAVLTTLILVSLGAYLFWQSGEPPSVSPDVIEPRGCQNPKVIIQSISSGGGGVVFYNESGKTYIDSNGDGETDAGEESPIRPGKRTNLLSKPSGRTYRVGSVKAKGFAGCLVFHGTLGERRGFGHGSYNASGTRVETITIDYESGVQFVGQSRPVVAVDTDGDSEMDINITDTVESVLASGSELVIELERGYEVKGEDTILYSYSNVKLPKDGGTYQVSLLINGEKAKNGTVNVTNPGD